MQNRFGLKDFVLTLMVMAVGLLVVLLMIQNDKHWEEMQTVKSDIQSVRDQTGRLQSNVENMVFDVNDSLDTQGRRIESLTARLESGELDVNMNAPGGTGPAATSADGWARPGVAITRPEQLGFAKNPWDDDGVRRGGELVELFEAQWPKITPYLYSDVYGRRIVDVVCQTLGDFDPETLLMKGVLADAWQYDPDGYWLRVHINPRARFSDGQPVTAEDVRWTFEDFMFNPEIEAERFRSIYNTIESVNVVDKQTVEFTFVDAMFKNLENALGFPIVPKHFYEQFTPAQLNQATGLLMGSGPYRVRNLDPDDQWAPPQDLVLVRNEQFWGQAPPIDALRFKAISDNLARLTAYENGEGDIMRGTTQQYEVKSNDVEFDEENYVLAWTNMRSGYSFIAWNCGDRNGSLTPFSDRRVRLAMTHLMDRNRILRDFYKGLGEVCTGPFSPTTPQSNPNIKPWPQDIDRARELLTEAGWIDRDGDDILENERGDEFTFEFTYSTGSSTAEEVAKYLRDQCAEVGIKLAERKVDWSIYQQLLNNRDFDAITMAWSASTPEGDPRQLWHSASIENQGDNFAQWNSPKADELIEAGRRELDHDARQKIWHEFHALIHEEQPYTFMINPPWIRFINKRVANVHTYPKGLEKKEMYIPAPAP